MTTTTTEPFDRTIHIGATKGMDVFVTIEYDGDRLSLTGVEGPKRNGDAKGGCGQIDMGWDDDYLDTLVYADGWDREQAGRLRDVWGLWHLNDMQAGTPRQMTVLRAHECGNDECRTARQRDRYGHDKGLLTSLGLNPDRDHNDYEYGTAWLTVEVPAPVLAWLAGLPAGTKTSPWENH